MSDIIAGTKICIRFVDKMIDGKMDAILSVSLNDSEFVSFNRIKNGIEQFLEKKKEDNQLKITT